MKLKEVQDRLFELLCLIDEICRKEDVTYFLDGGTEIGSVRDKDIIPWDDDADIKLKWSDYPAFRAAMKKHLPEGIILVEPEDFSPLFYDFFIRIVDTRFLRRKVTDADRAYKNMENYLCVDVSVHFHIPEKPLRRKIAVGRVKLLYGLGMGHRYHMDYSQYTGVQKLGVRALCAVGKLIPAKTVCGRFWKLADYYDRTAADSPCPTTPLARVVERVKPGLMTNCEYEATEEPAGLMVMEPGSPPTAVTAFPIPRVRAVPI